MNGYYNKKGKYLGAAENVRVCWNIKTEHEPHIYNTPPRWPINRKKPNHE